MHRPDTAMTDLQAGIGKPVKRGSIAARMRAANAKGA
jgi:hypothetical protein